MLEDFPHICDVEVSLLLQCEGISGGDLTALLANVAEVVGQWKHKARGSVRLMHADSDQPDTLFSMSNEKETVDE